MTELLLDSRILIEEPRILILDTNNYKLLTTPYVLEQIRSSGTSLNISYTNRLKLIENAVDKNIITIVPSTEEVEFIEEIEYSINSPRLDYIEKKMLAYILFKKQEGKKVYLVTRDRLLIKFANNYKIELFNISELDTLLGASEIKQESSSGIYQEIETYERKERSKISSGIFIGILLSFIAYEVYLHIELIIASTNVWGTISLIILLSFILYIIREKWRLPYGVLEFFVGVFSIVAVFYPNRFNLSSIALDSNLLIKVIGGLYIMVRGIDNVMIALNDTKFGIRFRRLFSIVN
jgi:hypothetical protein